MAENIYSPKRVVSGEVAANPRVFAHDALNMTPSGSVTTSQIPGTESPKRGAAIYIGQAMSITVQLEGSTGNVIFKGLAAGSFLPILVTAIVDYTLTDVSGTKGDWDIVALL